LHQRSHRAGEALQHRAQRDVHQRRAGRRAQDAPGGGPHQEVRPRPRGLQPRRGLPHRVRVRGCAGMSLIAIGDIHGCARTLDVLLELLAPSADDRLVFIGDYTDRGPDSKGTIDRLLELERAAEAGTGPRCTFLRGNHDQMMLDYLERGDFDLWRINGGLTTLENYARADGIYVPDAHHDFLRRTRLYLDTPDFCFVHAGLKPHYSVAYNLRHET